MSQSVHCRGSAPRNVGPWPRWPTIGRAIGRQRARAQAHLALGATRFRLAGSQADAVPIPPRFGHSEAVKLNDYPRSFLDQLAGSRLPSLPTRRRCRRAFVDRERLLDRLALSVCRQLFNGRQRHYLIEHAGTDAAESVAGFQRSCD